MPQEPLYLQNRAEGIGVGDGVAAHVVVEVSKDVAAHAVELADALRPPVEVGVGVGAGVKAVVVGAVQADVGKGRGEAEDAREARAAHDAVGGAVGEFAVNDQVFGLKGTGANAEWVSVPESACLAHKPKEMSFEEAAAVCDGGCSALSCLRQAGLREGQKIVVYGASGSIGSAAVQVAKRIGAEVTAVCNTENVELVRSLGADSVVDYTHDDFTRKGDTYDIIFDAVGRHSFGRCRHALKPGGLYMTTDLGFMWHAPMLALVTRWIGDKRVKLGIARYKKEDVLLLKELIEEGRYRPVIDRRYQLEQVVDATKYVESGQKTGNVVLTVRAD